MKKIILLTFSLCSLLISKSERFVTNYISKDKISLDFILNDYDVVDENGNNKIILINNDEHSKEKEQFSKFIHVDSDYSISLSGESVQLYDFSDNNNLNNSSSSFLSVKEHILRGMKLIQVSIDPVKYNNALNKIEVLESASVNIELQNKESINSPNLKKSRVFEELMNNIALTPFSSRQGDYQTPSILYISDPDVMSSPYLQALISWRKQQGYEVNLVSTDETGNSTTTIRNYIIDAYYNWENPPEYLCFIGDANGSVSVPTYDVSAGGGGGGAHGESDYPYTLIEGDDLLPEIIVGRISVRSSTELATVVQKIIGYEKAYGGLGDWISTAALVGDPYDSGISTVITNQYIQQIMENNGGIDVINPHTVVLILMRLIIGVFMDLVISI